jgi:hypothetical protein
MAKKLHFLLLCLVGAAFTFVGCGNHDPYDDGINWNGDNGGTLEITNGSATKDIVVFYGGVPGSQKSNILGGVRGGSTTTFDVCKHVDDCDAGGWIVLRGVTREQYEDNKADLGKAKVEFNAMATYRRGEKYRIQIDANYMGDNMVKIANVGRIGVELRKGSPEGEKVAYLPALKTDFVLYADKTEMITLFPVYVFYNKSAKEVTTLKATDMTQSVTVGPRPVNDPMIPNIRFPNNQDSWEKIVGTLKSPVAYITVASGVMNQGAYFTNSGGIHYKSQSGYDGFNSGDRLVFEVEADDSENGMPMNFMVKYYAGAVMASVTKAGETDPPRIKNGYNYTVSVSGTCAKSDASDCTATIEETGKRDLTLDIENIE